MPLGVLRCSHQLPLCIGKWDVSPRLDDGSRMSREAHVRFCEGLGVKIPRPTHPYLATDEGWLYLAVVLDLYARKVVGWAMSERMTARLTCDAGVWRCGGASGPGASSSISIGVPRVNSNGRGNIFRWEVLYGATE